MHLLKVKREKKKSHECIFISGHLNGINNFDARQEYMNNEQLKVMYEV